ncbi:sulfatase [Bacteroidales bacterium]|nr:sulfatase [Bacteroidales bacterium]
MKFNLTSSFLFVTTTVLLLSCNSKANEEKKPNFLFITCEDISPYLSFYGDTLANTPNLDQLAKESLIFDNAFTTVGVCAPSRSSLITGMYPVSIGTHNMRTGRDVMSWGQRDYDGSEKKLTDREGKPFCEYSAVLPADMRCYTTFLRREGYFVSNNHKTDHQFASPISAWDENNTEAHFNNRMPGQPFLSIFNMEITHESRLWLKAKDSLRVNANEVKIPSYIPDFKQARIDFARNYSNIEEMDIKIGKLLEDLKNTGEYENTYIFFFSDHGGPLPRGKRMIYDSGLKVPFMVSYPDKTKTGRTDRLISFVDIAPTILSLANIEIPDYMQGKAFLGSQKAPERPYIFGSGDRFDECNDRVRCIRDKDYMLVKNYFMDQPRYRDVAYRKQIPMMPEFLRMRDEGALNETQMLWFNPSKPEIEFYDVNADPEQVNNLAHLPEHQDKIKKMLTALEKWQEKIDDKGGVPEAQLLESMWPQMQQPQTAIPEVKLTNDGYEAICSTDGADIVYRYSETADTIQELDHWMIYTAPVEKKEGFLVHFRATRIGYKDSEQAINN